MVLTFETIAGSVITAILCKRRSRNAQSWISGKFSNQKLKVIRFERKVGIQITDYFKWNRSNMLQPCVKRVDLGSKVPI